MNNEELDARAAPMSTESPEELATGAASACLPPTVMLGTGVRARASGVMLLDAGAEPKNAAAVDVALSAALSVLNAGGPAARLRHAAWFSSLIGTLPAGFAGGGGVRLRERDHDFRAGASESRESAFRGDGVVDEVDKIRSEELGAAECVASDDGPGDDGPGASEVLVPSAGDEPCPAAAAAASCFFFSSASFR